MNIKIEIDVPGLMALKGKIAAVRETLTDTGRGLVFVGMRRKQKWEKRKPAHSFLILNAIKKKYHFDPAAPDAKEESELRDKLGKQAQAAVDLAARSGRQRRDRIRRALGWGGGGIAKEMADAAYSKIAEGRTGLQNTPRRAKKKRYLAQHGAIPSEFGIPPPFLIDTGRLLKSIKSRWNLGYNPASRRV